MIGVQTSKRGAQAVAAFTEAIVTGQGDIECGETWTLQDGWRTYVRTGRHALTLPPRAMRRLGERFRDHPEASPQIREIGELMVACANAAKEKSDRGVIPDGAAAVVPHQGRA